MNEQELRQEGFNDAEKFSDLIDTIYGVKVLNQVTLDRTKRVREPLQNNFLDILPIHRVYKTLLEMNKKYELGREEQIEGLWNEYNKIHQQLCLEDAEIRGWGVDSR